MERVQSKPARPVWLGLLKIYPHHLHIAVRSEADQAILRSMTRMSTSRRCLNPEMTLNLQYTLCKIRYSKD